MKKIIVLILSVVMLFSFSGCQSKKEETSKTDAAKVGRTENAGSQKLVIWAWDQNLPSINYAVEKYKKEHPDSKVEVVVQNVPDTVDKMSTFFASGVGTDLPDMVLMDNIQIQTFLQQFPDKFANLSAMGFDEFKDSFSSAHWELLSHEGVVYAFPFDIAPIMLEVNTEITKNAGIDPSSLKTWDDVIAATKAVNDGGYAMHIKFSENDVVAMMQGAGVGIFDEDRNIDLMNPKNVEVVNTFIKLQKANASDAVAEDNAVFGEGKAAIIMKPAWSIGEDIPVQTALNGKVTLVPMPKIKDADGYTSSANNGGSSFFILESSKVKEAAYEIGKIITTDLDAQDIALEQGLMPGYLPAAELDSFKKGVDYYSGQPIWQMLSESAKATPSIYVNEYYSTAKDMLKNNLVDIIKNGTNQTAEELLKQTADLIASQTGLTVKEY